MAVLSSSIKVWSPHWIRTIPFLATCGPLESAPALLHRFRQVAFHWFRGKCFSPKSHDSQKCILWNHNSAPDKSSQSTPQCEARIWEHLWKAFCVWEDQKLMKKKTCFRFYMHLCGVTEWHGAIGLSQQHCTWASERGPDTRTSERVNSSSSVNRRVRKRGGRHSAGEL